MLCENPKTSWTKINASDRTATTSRNQGGFRNNRNLFVLEGGKWAVWTEKKWPDCPEINTQHTSRPKTVLNFFLTRVYPPLSEASFGAMGRALAGDGAEPLMVQAP